MDRKTYMKNIYSKYWAYAREQKYGFLEHDKNLCNYICKNVSKKESLTFSGLLNKIAKIHPLLRIRFSTSNPQDMTTEVIKTMAKYNNICKYTFKISFYRFYNFSIWNCKN